MADAKKAQVVAMKDYIGGCQAFFEKVLTDILLRQPKDPHAFLVETLNNMTAEEKAKWQQRVVSATAGENLGALESEEVLTSSVALTKEAVIVVLRLNLNPEDSSSKEKVLAVLTDLRSKAKKLNGLLSYEISNRVGEMELLVTQTWANQAALDNYYAQPFFQEAAPKFTGLLSGHPDYGTYQPVL